jgi:hypothetical protein
MYEFRVRLALGVSPTPLQSEAAKTFAYLSTLTQRLYVTRQTANILQLRPPRFAAAILSDTQALEKGRYLRRWARRLRDFGFSPEDAMVIAYGSFGVDKKTGGVGVQAVVTSDLRMAANYHTHSAEISNRFEQMALNLPEPYQQLRLPEVVTTGAVLARI